jgi:hypothetical protein
MEEEKLGKEFNTEIPNMICRAVQPVKKELFTFRCQGKSRNFK